MKIKPFSDLLVIEPASPQEKTEGGIYLPENTHDKPEQGTVLAVGTGVRNMNGELLPMQAKVGDQILFHKYSGSEVKLDGKKYLILREADVLGVIES